MNVADMLGFGPKRVVYKGVGEKGETLYKVEVTPGALAGPNLPKQTVILTEAQFEGYQRWRQGELIQDALPDLSDSDREILMSGLGDADFKRVAGGEED